MNRKIVLEMSFEEVQVVLAAMDCCDPLYDLDEEDVAAFERAYGRMVQKTKKFFPLSVTSLLKVVPGSKS